MLRQLAIATFFSGLTVAAWADVYRTVDGQGHVQYTDRWVPGAELVKVDKNHPNTEGSAARQSAEHSKLAVSGDRLAAQQAENASAKAVQQDLAKSRDDQCKQAKDRYEKAIQARRIYKSDKDGQREYMSDAEADAYRVQAHTDMENVCKK